MTKRLTTMPFLERSRANPAPSNQTSFSLTLFNTPYHPQASSPLSQNLLSLTHHIATNIHESRRLLGLKAALLHPEDQDWMVAVIMDNEAALRNVAHLIEPARHPSALSNIPHFDNKINNNNNDKALWTLEDDEQVRDLHQHLSVSHASLMTLLSVLYLQDLRWVSSAGKQQQREPEEEAAPPLPPASTPLLVEPTPLRRQNRTTRQRRYVQCGATTKSVHTISAPPLPPVGCSAVIEDPYTWQQQPPPPASPPKGEREQLQLSKSDPTPQSCHHHHHHHHQEGIRPPSSSRYRHEHISSSYLANCRLTAPWTTEFAVPASGEEEGEALDDDLVRESSALSSSSSMGDENDAEELELPPRLSAGVRRRWSADVLRL